LQTLSVANFSTSPSSVATFKIGYAKGVAIALNVSASNVLVTSVQVTKRREMIRVLLAAVVKLSVTYTVKVPNGLTATGLQLSLIKAQANGALDTALKTAGIANPVTAAAIITDISPTRAPTRPPTYSPTSALTVKITSTTAAIIGGVVGGIGGALIICAIAYCTYMRVRPKIYITTEPIVVPVVRV
jgi:hypothetical protein